MTTNNKIYVGNLPYSTIENELEDIFSQYGEVKELVLIKDRETDQCKGFGFITFESDDQAQNALDFNGQEFQGRKLKVNIAMERQSRGGNRGGGGRRGGGQHQRSGNAGGGWRDRH